jgi:hypothetical protein
MFARDLDSSCSKAIDIIVQLPNARQSIRALVADQIEIDGTLITGSAGALARSAKREDDFLEA